VLCALVEITPENEPIASKQSNTMPKRQSPGCRTETFALMNSPLT
jgi:hypothetical protein